MPVPVPYLVSVVVETLLEAADPLIVLHSLESFSLRSRLLSRARFVLVPVRGAGRYWVKRG